jgi:non-ribosomal peptide synthetase-like protein
MNGMADHSGFGSLRPIEGAVLRGDVRPEFLRDEVLAEIFAATAAAHPDRTALVFGAERLTYAEVDARTCALARGLIRRGIGPGDVVGLWMCRGADLLMAQIAIAKTGAAWLPFDADAPADRIAVCLADADAKAILTSEAGVPRLDVGCPVVTPAGLVDASDATPLDPRARGLTPDHPAYLIYTSGSTGTPKGIVVTHRNICHFLRAANDLYGFRAEDVVFQGASVAFDLSMEEIWIPYMVGASLVVASSATLGDVERLPDFLAQAGVTVLDTVPTLLALLPRDIASVRLILLGGEALPQPLVTRWARPGRRLFNTYGPTEATVVATATEMRPGQPVTIGRPIPNYTCYVVDEALDLVPPGTAGELLIGGPGVAGGYLGRPELTAEKFIANPFAADGRDPVLYRSGDAVSVDPEGRIAFHGRIDDQVKIRGFRVELGEIEAKLAELPGVAQAAVVLRQDQGVDQLVAFLVSERAAPPDAAELRAQLREELPPYMVPGHFEIVDVLPRLSSGKADRKTLKGMTLTVVVAPGEQETPRNETEAALLVAAKRALGPQAIPFGADFFTDLGGHSLIAARFVSAIRETPALASVTFQDVYAKRTLRAIADELIARTGGAGAATVARDMSFEPPPLLRRFLCGLAQAVALPIILTLTTVQWLGIFVTYLLLTGEGLGFWAEMGALLAVYAMLNIVTAIIAVAGKWLVLGRTKPGRYPLWGVYYFRWWFAKRLETLVHLKWLQGSPMMAMYLRLIGGKVGRDVIIADIDAGALDLVTIGDGTTIGSKTKIANVEIIGNEMVIGRVDIGADVSIGSSCTLAHDITVGAHAELADLTAIAPGTRIGDAERWDGSPGRRVGTVDVAALPEPAEASFAHRRVFDALYVFILMAVPPISLLPIFPAFALFDQIDDVISEFLEVSYLWYLPVLAWPTALFMIFATVLLIALIRWAILPRVNSGRYSIFSGFYLRKWTVALATEVTLETLTSLYATVYMRRWYRGMGASIGHGAEISTNLAGRYDLSTIGAKNFIADEVVFGDEDVRRGWMTLEPVAPKDRVFVGNDAVVPPGAVIPEGVLIGIKSKPPANHEMSPGDTWFGSPPIKLPTRQKVDMGAMWTYEPSAWKKLGAASSRRCTPRSRRCCSSPSRSCRSTTCSIRPSAPRVGDAGARFRRRERAHPDRPDARGDRGEMAHDGGLSPAHEADVVLVGDAHRGRGGALLGARRKSAARAPAGHAIPALDPSAARREIRPGRLHAHDRHHRIRLRHGGRLLHHQRALALQTHLYEDRVMKVGRVRLGRGVVVGANSTVLYDSHIGDYAHLRPLTVVMKARHPGSFRMGGRPGGAGGPWPAGAASRGLASPPIPSPIRERGRAFSPPAGGGGGAALGLLPRR